MNIIVCIDDNNGTMFNHRRQSQDKILRNYILNMVDQHKLWMTSYTKKQFAQVDYNKIIIDEQLLDKAENGDYCFIEGQDFSPYIHKVEKIIIFKWNRVYPADTFLPLNLYEWKLVETDEFVGNTHDKITKEMYSR